MARDRDQELARFAATNYAVFTGVHASTVGLTKKEREHRVDTGQWIVVHENVFRSAGAPRCWKGDLLAACWAGGFRAAASHRSAAALWGFAGGRREIAEITCPRWRRARHDGVVVHESKAIDAIDLTVIAGIPVTKPDLTLLHLAAVTRASVVEMALDAAEKRELVTRASVEALLARLGKQGRNGIGTLRRLLETRDPARTPTESEMETKVLQVIRRHGLPAPVTQHEIFHHGAFVARADAAYPQWRVAIEYDSYQEHTGRMRIDRDTERRLKVQRAGWAPVTATAANLRRGGALFVEAVLASRKLNSPDFATPKRGGRAS